jgi:hypothetical protein
VYGRFERIRTAIISLTTSVQLVSPGEMGGG